jgi:flagellar basal body-associated protein FliL
MKCGKYSLLLQFGKGLGLALVMAAAQPALAAGGGAAKGAPEGINYIPISPPLVVNYGGPGKARYIKAELSVRSENATDANLVTHHLPLIRDRLVSILSAQSDAIVSSAEGKEYLRRYALAEINKALLQVQGLPITETAVAGTGASPQPASAPTSTASTATTSTPPSTAAAPAATPAAPEASTASQLPEVIAIKGPASDLYFNNFVVQK